MLWLGTGDEAFFGRLYQGDKEGMRTLKFSWGGEAPGQYDHPVCWEVVPAPCDLDYVAAFRRVDAAACEEEGRLARLKSDAEAREEPECYAERQGRLRRAVALRACLADQPWA